MINSSFSLSGRLAKSGSFINIDILWLNSAYPFGPQDNTKNVELASIKSLRSSLNNKPDSKNSDKALFLSEQKKRISNRTVQLIITKELEAAGLDTKKLSVHKLRHTAATLMYQYGNVDIRALQELLGHESIATTEIYTHVSNEQVRDAIERNPLNQ